VFTRELIPRGAKVWVFHPTFDIRYTEEEFEALPPVARQEIEIRLYRPVPGGYIYYESTMGKYMNHSLMPMSISARFVWVGPSATSRPTKSRPVIAAIL